MSDSISRQAAIDALTEHAKWLQERYHETCSLPGMINAIDELPSAQLEYTEHEKVIMTMLFGMAETILDVQDGYMDIDGKSFSRNDLFNLSEKLGIEDY